MTRAGRDGRPQSRSRSSRSGARRTAGARTGAGPGRCSPSLSVQVEDGEEGFLGEFDHPDLLHPLLAGFLSLEQLALAADVAAVTLREHVLAPGLDGLARDDARTDRGLDRDVEHLPRDLLAEPIDERASALVREVAVDNERQGVHGLAPYEHIDPDEIAWPEAGHVVVETGVATGARLQLVVVVEHD